MRIRDEGPGFDLVTAGGKGGLGLISMQQRARAVQAELDVTTSFGEGTVVTVLFRLPGPA